MYIKDYEDSELLKEIGAKGIESLFSDIPSEARIEGLDLPEGMSEYELGRKMENILSMNKRVLSFLGGGVYQHHIPAAVRYIISRGEFFTSYTPYQPEVSQGMLQAQFEYQSQICELTGMEVANASLYDGATALGEAALMAARVTGKREFVIPEAISPERKHVLLNYTRGAGMVVKEMPSDRETGGTPVEAIMKETGEDTAGVYIESPNYFGVLEESLTEIRTQIPEKALLVVGINPISLGVLEPPGNYGADIVIGEGQPLGLPVNLGGPLLGIFAARKKFVRKMPGRIIGLTKDAEGKRAFAMTLQTREQHIRREKATSNICSNQALCAVAAGAYLASAGRTGLRKIALLNLRGAHALAERLNQLPEVTAPAFRGPFFNEFTVRIEGMDAEKVREALVKEGIEPGIPLGKYFEGMKEMLLTATTEVHTSEDNERLVRAMSNAIE